MTVLNSDKLAGEYKFKLTSNFTMAKSTGQLAYYCIVKVIFKIFMVLQDINEHNIDGHDLRDVDSVNHPQLHVPRLRSQSSHVSHLIFFFFMD